VQLAQPEMTFMQATGPHEIVVKWNTVPNAASYSLKYSTDPNVMLDVEAKYPHSSATQATLDALLPNTTYYAHIKANAGEGNTESAYSIIKAATTPVVGGGGGDGGNGGGGDTADNMQQWLNVLKTVSKQYFIGLPAFGAFSLSPVQRRRMLGSGVRRYGFIDLVSDTAAEYPQFWPASITGTTTYEEEMKDGMRELEVLRNLHIWLQWLTRVVGDMKLIAGDENFRLANIYYTGVTASARKNLDGAAHVFEQLKLFWNKTGGTKDKITKKQAVSDFKAVADGKKDGYVAATNESDTVIEGKRGIVDDARPRQQISERATVEREEIG